MNLNADVDEKFDFFYSFGIGPPILETEPCWFSGHAIQVENTFRICFMIEHCFAVASAEAPDADCHFTDLIEITICLGEGRHDRATELLAKVDLDPEEFWHFIASNKLKNLFASASDFVDCLPEPLPTRLRKHLVHQRIRQQEYTSELAFVASTFQDAGIRMLALKGPALGQRIFGDPLRRFFCDLDTLVDPAQVENAIALLESLGYGITGERKRLSRHRLRTNHAIELRRENNRLDLHWHLRNVSFYRIDMQKIWADSQTTEFCGTAVSVPSDEHTLVLLCLSIVDDLSLGKLRIKHILDLYFMLQLADRICDWDKFFAARHSDNTLSVILNALAILDGITPTRSLPVSLRECLRPYSRFLVTRDPKACQQLVVQRRRSFLVWLWIMQVYPANSFRDLVDFFKFQLPHIGSAPRMVWRLGLRTYQAGKFLAHHRRLKAVLSRGRYPKGLRQNASGESIFSGSRTQQRVK